MFSWDFVGAPLGGREWGRTPPENVEFLDPQAGSHFKLFPEYEYINKTAGTYSNLHIF